MLLESWTSCYFIVSIGLGIIAGLDHNIPRRLWLLLEGCFWLSCDNWLICRWEWLDTLLNSGRHQLVCICKLLLRWQFEVGQNISGNLLFEGTAPRLRLSHVVFAWSNWRAWLQLQRSQTCLTAMLLLVSVSLQSHRVEFKRVGKRLVDHLRNSVVLITIFWSDRWPHRYLSFNICSTHCLLLVLHGCQSFSTSKRLWGKI